MQFVQSSTNTVDFVSAVLMVQSLKFFRNNIYVFYSISTLVLWQFMTLKDPYEGHSLVITISYPVLFYTPAITDALFSICFSS